MNNVPLEIYDNIVSNFQHCIPPYQQARFDSLQTQGNTIPPKFEYLRPDVKTLHSLRLTSKAFGEAATAVLLQSTPLVWKVGKLPDWKVGEVPGYPIDFPLIKDIERSVTASNATITSKIKKLKIDFQSFGGWNGRHSGCFEAAEDKVYVRPEVLETPFGTIHPRYPCGNFERLERPRRARLLIRKMPEIFEKLNCLKALTVISGLWVSIYGGRGEEWAPALDTTLISSLAEAIAVSMRTANFEHLTELKLSLPCSENFVAISKAMPEKLAHQLKTLFLAYTDATGPNGSNDYLRQSSETADNDNNYPPSNLQEEYPNQQYTYAMFDIVSQCPNLQVLGLAGTHFLDGNLLDWKSKATSLESLLISRMNITSKNLISLLSPPAHHLTMDSSVTNIELEWVDLTDGLWEEVFRYLYTLCPKLAYLNPKNLSYARNGRSAHLKEWNVRPHENASNLWSLNGKDGLELLFLIHGLAEKAGGRTNYSNLGMEQDIYPYVEEENMRLEDRPRKSVGGRAPRRNCLI